MKDEHGAFFQAVPISPKVGRIIENAKNKFKRIFGREPKGNDPMMVEKYLVSIRDIERETLDAMLRAGTPPELMYAYRKTGRLLTKKASRLIPDKDVQEWHDAIAEYQKIKESTLREPALLVQLRSFVGELDSCMVMFGYFLENGITPFKRAMHGRGHKFTVHEYFLFCITKCFSTLRSIDWMIDKDRGADAMPLIRSLYDCYLHLRFIHQHPEKFDDLVLAKLGLQAGTHSFAKNATGKPDRRIILDNATGQKYEGHISAYRMAEASSNPTDIVLFPYLYEYLSGFVHPSIEYMPDYAAHYNSMDPMHDGRLLEATFHAITIACMLLDYVRHSTYITTPVAQDLKRVLTRIGKKAIQFLSRHVNEKSGPLEKYLLQRWNDIERANA